ncbi:MAG TPA: response regulator [Chloroflexi bacterium]|nr:response regulator [Chloroflexota bacterium]
MGNYVLIVDDDPDVRGLITDVLTMLGVKTRKAVNGVQALQMVHENPPAAIMLDLMMPVMDGFSTLVRLQADPLTRRIPVILMSAMIDNERHMRKLPGVAGVIPKGDFSIRRLKSVLEQAKVRAEPLPGGKTSPSL